MKSRKNDFHSDGATARSQNACITNYPMNFLQLLHLQVLPELTRHTSKQLDSSFNGRFIIIMVSEDHFQMENFASSGFWLLGIFTENFRSPIMGRKKGFNSKAQSCGLQESSLYVNFCLLHCGTSKFNHNLDMNESICACFNTVN